VRRGCVKLSRPPPISEVVHASCTSREPAGEDQGLLGSRPGGPARAWRTPKLALAFAIALVCVAVVSALLGTGAGAGGGPSVKPYQARRALSNALHTWVKVAPVVDWRKGPVGLLSPAEAPTALVVETLPPGNGYCELFGGDELRRVTERLAGWLATLAQAGYQPASQPRDCRGLAAELRRAHLWARSVLRLRPFEYKGLDRALRDEHASFFPFLRGAVWQRSRLRRDGATWVLSGAWSVAYKGNRVAFSSRRTITLRARFRMRTTTRAEITSLAVREQRRYRFR